jgi:hypothetical protein
VVGCGRVEVGTALQSEGGIGNTTRMHPKREGGLYTNQGFAIDHVIQCIQSKPVWGLVW